MRHSISEFAKIKNHDIVSLSYKGDFAMNSKNKKLTAAQKRKLEKAKKKVDEAIGHLREVCGELNSYDEREPITGYYLYALKEAQKDSYRWMMNNFERKGMI